MVASVQVILKIKPQKWNRDRSTIVLFTGVEEEYDGEQETIVL